MEIKLDPEAMVALASKAIFDSMNEQKREEILKLAVGSLLKPETNSYAGNYAKTPLQGAFERAISDAAYLAVKEKIAEDPRVSVEIEKLIGPMIMSTIETEEKEAMSSSLADAVGKALGSWLSDIARNRTNE